LLLAVLVEMVEMVDLEGMGPQRLTGRPLMKPRDEAQMGRMAVMVQTVGVVEH
jgi:hypothetical protein